MTIERMDNLLRAGWIVACHPAFKRLDFLARVERRIMIAEMLGGIELIETPFLTMLRKSCLMPQSS